MTVKIIVIETADFPHATVVGWVKPTVLKQPYGLRCYNPVLQIRWVSPHMHQAKDFL